MTPLHYPLAYGIHRLGRGRLRLPGVIVGAVIPDIEVPLLIIFFPNLPDHLLLHSLLGAVTVGLCLAVIATRTLYAPIVSWLFGLDRGDVGRRCRITPALSMSCLLGLLSHLLVDYLIHPFNPLLWPFVDPYSLPGPLILLLAPNADLAIGFARAAILTNSVLLLAWIIILVDARGPQLWSRVWVE